MIRPCGSGPSKTLGTQKTTAKLQFLLRNPLPCIWYSIDIFRLDAVCLRFCRLGPLWQQFLALSGRLSGPGILDWDKLNRRLIRPGWTFVVIKHIVLVNAAFLLKVFVVEVLIHCVLPQLERIKGIRWGWEWNNDDLPGGCLIFFAKKSLTLVSE